MLLHSKAGLLAGALLAGVSLLPAQTSLDTQYRDVASKIIDAAQKDDEGYQRLSFLCDRIGNRLSGSESLNRAIEWGAAEMRKSGFANVVTPKVMVPHWVRGQESATLTEPVRRDLVMLGLGDSVGTPPQGITAQVIPVSSFEELESLGNKVAGKIVLFNVPFEGYGKTVRFRVAGPSRAAKLGAVAMLLRSVTPLSLQSPHTGTTRYDESAPKIPAAALSIEHALLLQRLYDSGTHPTVTLKMEAKMLPDAPSANVIGELRGREKPDEVVVMGGHIDSWDVGQGAQDDGGGIVSALQALTVLKKLGLQPRRTIRVVMWTNEENGGAGGIAYRKWAGEDQVKKHVAAIEMDEGAEKPVGFGLTGGSPQAMSVMQQIGRLLAPINAGTMTEHGGGSDISPLMEGGVPGLGLNTIGTHYFDWHHTQSDTVDKVDPANLKLNTAALAVVAYVLADMDGRL